MELIAERKLLKSEPELRELVAADDRFAAAGLRVSLLEKGLGTQVRISAGPGAGLDVADLERLLDHLAEPQKRPFSAP